MSVKWNSFAVPEKAALDQASGLSEFLRANHAGPIRLDLRAVDRVDTLLVQYLVAAARDWTARGLAFEVTGVGDRLAAGWARIGLGPDHLAWQGGAA